MSETPAPVSHYANWYARVRGWRLLRVHRAEPGGPCSCIRNDCGKSAGKHPRDLLWPEIADNGVMAQYTWFYNQPWNVGVATGPGSDIWVLDLDGPAGLAALARLEAEHGPLPPCPTVQTPSGGRHLYFAWPECGPYPGSRSKIHGVSIDTKGEGGYVVAPPSTNPKGRYVWLVNPQDVPPPQAPSWLLDWVAPPPPAPPQPRVYQPRPCPPGRPSAYERAREYLYKIEPAVSGQGGHRKTFWAARCMALGFDLGADVAFELLLSDYNPHCDPPWTDVELRHKCDEADAKAFNKPRGWLLDEERPEGRQAKGAPPAAACQCADDQAEAKVCPLPCRGEVSTWQTAHFHSDCTADHQTSEPAHAQGSTLGLPAPTPPPPPEPLPTGLGEVTPAIRARAAALLDMDPPNPHCRCRRGTCHHLRNIAEPSREMATYLSCRRYNCPVCAYRLAYYRALFYGSTVLAYQGQLYIGEIDEGCWEAHVERLRRRARRLGCQLVFLTAALPGNRWLVVSNVALPEWGQNPAWGEAAHPDDIVRRLGEAARWIAENRPADADVWRPFSHSRNLDAPDPAEEVEGAGGWERVQSGRMSDHEPLVALLTSRDIDSEVVAEGEDERPRRTVYWRTPAGWTDMERYILQNDIRNLFDPE